MTPELGSLAGIVAALSVGVVSPGPSFVMVARTAVAQSRSQGVAAALGMGAGGVVFAGAALLGLQAVLLAVPGLYLALKVLGGLYLCYLGFAIFRGAGAALPMQDGGGSDEGLRRRSLWLGLTTQLSNPKTAIVYASVFAAFLPPQYSAAFAAALIGAVLCIEAGWYAIVAPLLSSPAPRRAYLSCRRWIDRTAGLVLFGLGLRLVAAAHEG